MQTVYEFVDRTKGIGRPSRMARAEQGCLCSLAPLIQADLSRIFSATCLATDASFMGAGVTYTTISEEECLTMSGGEEVVGGFASKSEWKTDISYRWKRKERIDILEGEAVVLGLQWYLRKVQAQGSRVVFLVDNQTLIGALRKERSSSQKLNKICRKVSSLVLAGDLYIDYYYIRSAENPADGPSRKI